MIPSSARLPLPSQNTGQTTPEHPADRKYLNLTSLPWTPHQNDLIWTVTVMVVPDYVNAQAGMCALAVTSCSRRP